MIRWRAGSSFGGGVPGTVINATAKKQETDLIQALQEVAGHLDAKFPGVRFAHEKAWRLCDIVDELRNSYSEVDFSYHFTSSSIRPDGGFLYIRSQPGDPLTYPISDFGGQEPGD